MALTAQGPSHNRPQPPPHTLSHKRKARITGIYTRFSADVAVWRAWSYSPVSTHTHGTCTRSPATRSSARGQPSRWLQQALRCGSGPSADVGQPPMETTTLRARNDLGARLRSRSPPSEKPLSLRIIARGSRRRELPSRAAQPLHVRFGFATTSALPASPALSVSMLIRKEKPTNVATELGI